MSNQPKPKDEIVAGLDPVAAAEALRERRAYRPAPLIVPGMMRGAIARAARTTGRLGPMSTRTGAR